MKAYILQPQYSNDLQKSDELFYKKIEMLNDIGNDADIVVLPEYSDVPCAVKTKEELSLFHEKYMDILVTECIKTAKKNQCVVFFNALDKVNNRYRNTTFAVNKNGEIVGKYYKTHIPPGEKALDIDDKYTIESSEPYILEIDGIRYGFLTCYDFYFYEAFPRIARYNVDIIIGCSLQRSDSHYALETMCRFLAYNTNAYVLRSSVSYDENATICGASMAVTPEGRLLMNMEGKFGYGTCEFDPHSKYLKPAGFGRPLAPHYEYIEEGRNPWQYRNCGSAICPTDKLMKFPRICAESNLLGNDNINIMASIGSLVGIGVNEIKLNVSSINNEPITKCGIGYVNLEKILQKFACHSILNLQIEDISLIEKVAPLIKKYDCIYHTYFTSSNVEVLNKVKNLLAECKTCSVGSTENQVDKIQLNASEISEEIIKKLHSKSIVCNVVCNDIKEVNNALKSGADTIIYNKCIDVIDLF